MDGILLIDKPKGWTSHDIVAKVRGILKKQAGHKIKVGHAGTLDPLATGLLVVLVGSYCKRASEFSKLDKIYEVEMRLGEISTTGDAEGVKTIVNTDKPSETKIKDVLESFLGKISQVPHVFSAVKVGGKRAYKLAREGKKVEIEPRKITIYGIGRISYKYPNISFVVKVSSGTYIRSLVEDIGKVLGTGAYMSDLRRVRVGQFEVKNASLPTDLTLAKLLKV